MRQIVIAVVVFVLLNLAVPALTERFLTTAPPWLVQLGLSAFAIACVVAFLLSDPVFSRISDPKQHPVAFAALISLALVAAVAAPWWIVHSNRNEPEVVLDWLHPTPPGGFVNDVAVFNRKRSGLMNVEVFVFEVRARTENGTYEQIWFPFAERRLRVAGGGVGHVAAGDRQVFEFLNLALDSDETLYLGSDVVTTAGEWEAALKATWHNQEEPLFKTFRFGWQSGEPARRR